MVFTWVAPTVHFNTLEADTVPSTDTPLAQSWSGHGSLQSLGYACTGQHGA
jgi:hypothetical protein